jgi:hypothetical protein
MRSRLPAIEVAVLEYSHHVLILLAGLAVAVLALIGAIAVGPYGRRGVRPVLTVLSLAAFAGSGFWLFTYLGMIDQRRAIEARLGELRAQALRPGSAFACLERTGAVVETACAQTVFAAPETLATANAYTAARLDALSAALRFSGPRTPQFNDTMAAVQESLQQDPFGLTANVLVQRGCTVESCNAIALLADPTRVWDNIRQQTFEANLARYAAGWRAPGASAAGPTVPTGGETRAPIPDKYTLPSASSIPPVSIMNDEPLRPAPPPAAAAAKDRPESPPPAQAEATPAPASAPAALPRAKQPAAPKQQRRDTRRTNAPLSIAPK